MTRQERLQQSFTKDMRLIEIGASYNPLIPKSEGWNTTVVDHASQAELVEKYRTLGVQADNIEKVDFVWRDGPLIDAIPSDLHGTFDGLIASHVGEHMPDLIGFLGAAQRLLKPSGVLVLALPDKRLCFDFFQPLTTTGDLLNARGRTRHSLGTLYNHAAYMSERGTAQAWVKGGAITPFRLTHDFDVARKTVNEQLHLTHPQSPLQDATTDEYVDSHTWYFTPSSFHLLILELNLLRQIPWDIERLEPTDAIEFYVWLRPREIEMTPDIGALRLQLLEKTVMEAKEQIAMLEPQISPQPKSSPRSISVVIPLYNGAKFIGEALRSVLSQTVSPKEIIVVDDGSTDNGPDLVRAMVIQHPITLLSKPNGGQSSARNFGVAHSTGDLIALLDQDDIWYRTHLERLLEPFLQDSGAELGWVYSDLDEIDTEGLMVCNSFLSSMAISHPKRDLFACLREDMFILPSASLISRQAFDAVGGFDERLSGYEDDDLFLRLFRAGYGNVFIKTALSKWRIYPESSSYSYRMRKSRAIYCRKLLATYVDDPRRSRYIHRDLILPRFYNQAAVEYRDALISGDSGRIHECHEELKFLVDRLPSKRRIFGRILTLARSQRMARFAFSARHVLRPVLRRII